MVESIYFLKPAWCGTHPAGLWPEQDLQSVTQPPPSRRWFVTPTDKTWTDTDSLPSPDVLATEITDDLEAALEQFSKIAARLTKIKVPGRLSTE